MPTKRQKEQVARMRVIVRKLRNSGKMTDKAIENLIKSLNLPLSIQLNLLSVKK